MRKRGFLLAALASALVLGLLFWPRGRTERAPLHGGEATEPSPAAASAPPEEEPEAKAASRRVVAGRVVDESGAPVAGATVAVVPGGNDGSTDAEGRFDIEGRYGGFVRCAATAPGFRMTLGPWLPFEGERLDAGTIRLGRGLRLAGRVVDSKGLGVAGAEIRLQREGTASEEWEALLWQFGFEETDAEGRFAFDGLDEAFFRISASVYDPDTDDDIRRTKEHLRAGGEDVVFVFPVSQRPVEGRISVVVTLPDGRPLPNGTLVAGAASTAMSEPIVDGRGAAEIRDAGSAWIAILYAADENRTPLPFRPVLRTDVTPRAEPYEITLEAGETIEGFVATPSGSPLPAAVSLMPSRFDVDPGLMRRVTLNDQVIAETDGRFRFVGLLPGRYAFRASLASYVGTQPFVLARAGDRDVRIEMRRAGSISLRVLAPEGDFLGGGSFTILSLGRAGEVERGTQTVSIGRNSRSSSIETTFDGLVEGEVYRIRASVNRRGWGRYAPVEVDAVAGAGDPVEVRLRRGRTLSGRVLRSTDAPVAAAVVRVRIPAPAGLDENAHRAADYGQAVATSGLDGRFEMHGVPESAFWLTAKATALVQPEGPVAVPSQATEVEIRMVPALEVSGRITGEPPLDFRIDWIPGVVAGEAAAIQRDWEWSGADGFFALRALPPGTLAISGWRPWAEDDDRYVHAEGVEAGTSGLRLPVLQGCKLEGTVEDRDGQPISMATVFVEAPWGARDARTDENGRFVLHALPRGRHLVRVAQGEAVAADAPGPPIRLVR